MKKLFLILVLIFVASASFAQTVGTPIKLLKNDGTWVYAKADENGYLVISGIASMSGGTGISTFTMVMPDPVVVQDKIGRVSGATFYRTYLATDSVTTLQNICSFTVPVLIQIDHQGDQYMGAVGSSAAEIQLSQYFANGTKWTLNPSTDTFNIGFTSNKTASSPILITIWNLTQ